MILSNKVEPEFWRGKKVFLTGHTGFKGSWLTLWLLSMGAEVTGYSLSPITTPNLYEVLGLDRDIKNSIISDIRDFKKLNSAVLDAKPDIVIHLAAQALVRSSYEMPLDTYSINVMGTANILECIRNSNMTTASVMVTSDKCYENKKWHWGYRENDEMGGSDPYSNSKGCAELVIDAYRQSFFSDNVSVNMKHAVASARAGNVIGGGDWSIDRLIPDAIKAFNNNEQLVIRSPHSIRPWQHVLEPLSGYLMLAQALYKHGESFASAWNFGPSDDDAISVQSLLQMYIKKLGRKKDWIYEDVKQVHEEKFLKLDCSKAHHDLGWRPKWSLDIAIDKIIEWQDAFNSEKNMHELTLSQINGYTKYNMDN